MYNAAMSILIKLGRELPLVEALFVEMPTRGIERDRITFSVMMDAVFRAGTRTIRGKKDRCAWLETRAYPSTESRLKPKSGTVTAKNGLNYGGGEKLTQHHDSNVELCQYALAFFYRNFGRGFVGKLPWYRPS
jgi:hypothetical protein